LTEFLAALSAKGSRVRGLAASVVERVFRRNEFIVLPQTHQSFLKGLSLYKRRPDKRYSLVDCISMEAMKAHGLREALTNDQHFTQEGFVALMRG
jgi:predicted nucleic acid-binding protein